MQNIEASTAMASVKVAAAIILDKQERILLSQRHIDAHQGGLWEFPGGKVEVNETVLQAMQREVEEELNITVQTAELFYSQHFVYPEKTVEINFFLTRDYQGCPQAMENQKISWVSKEQLLQLDFPAANQAVLAKLLELLELLELLDN